MKGDGLLSLIGNTPLLHLEFAPEGISIWAKCEFLNPSGSIKDRFARSVIRNAEAAGRLEAGSVILECTSGNTGISLAMIGAARGHRVAILMSHSASEERRRIIHQFGAELILFDGSAGYDAGIRKSREMAAQNPRYFLPCQFENPLNAEDHEHETGRELLSQIGRPIELFVSGYGTGGTLAGVGRAIKKRFPAARVIAMEPAEAALLCGEMPCCHSIEGVTGGFVPKLLRTAPLDGEVKVTSAQAMEMTKRLHREFGLPVGTSSGANVHAAIHLAQDLKPGATVVTLLCDRAERYFSTRLFSAPATIPLPYSI